MNKKEIMKKFHKLSKKEQNEIRSSYKKTHNKDYRYSINLFIVYVVVGIAGLLGLIYFLLYGNKNGIYIYIGSFILLIGLVLLLNQSNQSFYKYLNNKLKKKD
jgi:hypothetical protein